MKFVIGHSDHTILSINLRKQANSNNSRISSLTLPTEMYKYSQTLHLFYYSHPQNLEELVPWYLQ